MGPDVEAVAGPAAGISVEDIRRRDLIGSLEGCAGPATGTPPAGPAVVSEAVTVGGGSTTGDWASTPASRLLTGGMVTAATRRFTSRRPGVRCGTGKVSPPVGVAPGLRDLG
eukprot:5368664-Amphidinium_carterae.1